MRIIGGELRRRLLASPPDERTRPMPDRVREALFNTLRGHCEGASVLDAFAGSGAIGLEALSRGASECVFIEKDRQSAAALRENIEALGVGDRARLVIGDALGHSALARCPRPAHLVFFDPPYPMMEDARQRARVMAQFERLVGLLDPEGYAVLRTPWPFVQKEREGTRASVIDLRVPGAVGPETHEYGSMALHLYMRDAAGG